MSVPALPVTNSVTLYTTTWCHYCRELKHDLDRAGVSYAEVDVEDDPEAAVFVEGVNGGNCVVPTVVFPDGGTATNPSAARVARRLGLSA